MGELLGKNSQADVIRRGININTIIIETCEADVLRNTSIICGNPSHELGNQPRGSTQLPQPVQFPACNGANFIAIAALQLTGQAACYLEQQVLSPPRPRSSASSHAKFPSLIDATIDDLQTGLSSGLFTSADLVKVSSICPKAENNPVVITSAWHSTQVLNEF